MTDSNARVEISMKYITDPIAETKMRQIIACLSPDASVFWDEREGEIEVIDEDIEVRMRVSI